jgi:uncharacterized membrane protein YkoI
MPASASCQLVRAIMTAWASFAMRAIKLLSVALATVLAVLSPLPAPADGDETDQDEARDAVQRGAARPLAEILSHQQMRALGDIVRVKLRREHGRWTYELRGVDNQGNVREYSVDAATGAVVGGDD